VTFSNVTTGGTTTVTSSRTGTPPPSGFKLGQPPVYYDLSTTAGFTGPIQVCIHYTGVSFAKEQSLKLFHQEDTDADGTPDTWRNVTDPGYPDTVNDVICGTVTGLSPFAMFEPAYAFQGFLPPLENAPFVNTARAGAVIPLKWRLLDDLGAITAIRRQQVSCESGGPENDLDGTATSGDSGLRFDETTGQFVYTWKTERNMAGTCRVVSVEVYGADTYQASFELR
jgi:hypothetical protein